MTARRRRKSGSGPSAAALIAWVGGDQPVATGTGVHAWSSSWLPGGRAVLVGRVCGLAAGTVLACGSLLASASHVGDGSLANEGASPLPSHPPAVPGAVSGNPDGYAATMPSEDVSAAAPVAVRAQTFSQSASAPRSQTGRIHRNPPLSLGASVEHDSPSHTAQPPWRSSAPPADDASSRPIAPVNPVLDPPASPVGQVPAVGGVLEPAAPRGGRSASPGIAGVPGTRVVVPRVDETTQPAMAVLGALLPS